MINQILEIIISESIPNKEKLGRIIAVKELDKDDLLKQLNRLSIVNDNIRKLTPEQLDAFIAVGFIPASYMAFLFTALELERYTPEVSELTALFDSLRNGRPFVSKYIKERMQARAEMEDDTVPAKKATAAPATKAVIVPATKAAIAAAKPKPDPAKKALIARLAKMPDTFPPTGFTAEWFEISLQLSGASPERFAAQAGISVSLLNEILAGTKALSMQDAALVCTALKISDSLVGRSLIERAEADFEIRRITEEAAEESAEEAQQNSGAAEEVATEETKEPEQKIYSRKPRSDKPIKNEYPAKTLDHVVFELFQNSGKADHLSIATEKEIFIQENRRLAQQLADMLIQEWEMRSNRQVVIAIGLNSGAHYRSFYKMESSEWGIRTTAIKDMVNIDGTPAADETKMELSCLIRGNPTIPDARRLAEDASELLYINRQKMSGIPEDNVMAIWMRMLHEKYPKGGYIDADGNPAANRVPNALLDALITRYGIVISDMWPTLDSEIKGMREGSRSVAININGKDEPFNARRFAEPFSYDKKLQSALELAFIEIDRKRKPAELMAEVDANTLTIGQMHKTLRLQKFCTIIDRAREIEGRRAPEPKLKSVSDAISRLENGRNISAESAAKLSEKLCPKDANAALKDNIAMKMEGRKELPKVTREDLIAYVRNAKNIGDAAWPEFYKMFMLFKGWTSHLQASENSEGQIKKYSRSSGFAKGTFLRTNTSDDELIVWMLKQMEVTPEDAIDEDFKNMAFGKIRLVSKKAVELLIRPKELEPAERAELLVELRKAAKLSKEDVASDLEVSNQSYPDWESTGIIYVNARTGSGAAAVNEEKSRFCIRSVSERLIGENYPQHEAMRKSFNKSFIKALSAKIEIGNR